MKEVPVVCYKCGEKTKYTKIENVYGGILVCCDKCKMERNKKERR